MDKYVIANWKQNKNKTEISEWLDKFVELMGDGFEDVKVIVAPSFPYLYMFDDAVANIKNFYVAGQDVSQFEEGRKTGQVGSFQLRDFVEYCIVGHSETEDDVKTAMEKGIRCLENNIVPILCFVDETTPPKVENVVLAWEDPKNISTEEGFHAAGIEEIEKTALELRDKLSSEVKILYGGSVNRQNAREISNISQLDGVLVGNASLDPEHFYEIVQAFVTSQSDRKES